MTTTPLTHVPMVNYGHIQWSTYTVLIIEAACVSIFIDATLEFVVISNRILKYNLAMARFRGNTVIIRFHCCAYVCA